MNRRRSLTKRERAQMALDQHGKCGCGCGEKLDRFAVAEHLIPVALGNDQKPDALWNRDCADKKTNGFLGDKHKIAKVKRLRDKRTQYDKRLENGPKLKGQGFDKSRSKKIGGSVSPRGAV